MDMQALDALTKKLTELLFIPVEASGRHVHVTKEQAITLFGHPLTPQRPLSQPGQFLAKERLTIRTDKGEFRNVAVLGPERKEAQVEISLTDARTLGLTPPIRQSGDVSDSPGVILAGSDSSICLNSGVIIAQRHIHLSPKEAAHFGVTDKQIVSLQTYGSRPVLWQNVMVRVSPSFSAAAHLDYDEANACALGKDALGRIIP